MKRVLVAGVALVAFLAGCGGDEATPTTAATTVAEEPGEEADDQPAEEEPGGDTAGGDEQAAPDLGDLAAGPRVDACSLLTPGEIEGVLGLATAEGVPDQDPAPFYGCRWESESFEGVSLSVISWAGPDEARSSFDFFLGEVTEIDGIGDAALSNILTDLAFIVDGFEVTIDVLVDDEMEVQQQMAKELAPIVISRLP